MKSLLPAITLVGGAIISLALSHNVSAAPALDPTEAKLPDLVVTSVGVLESEDQVGADAHFIARIENRGDGATKRDVAHGVAFYVDGEFVAWSDTYRQDLKPGQFAILRSNSGPNGSATWKITPGQHTIRAVVDDVRRVDESNEDNNSLENTLEWKAMAVNNEERPEFHDVSLDVYDRLAKIERAGLFASAHGTKLRAMPVVRYEAAVLLARLQDEIPDLTGDKATSLRALTAATADSIPKLSPTEVESLGNDIGVLQTEFHDDLQRINGRGSFLEVRGLRNTPPPHALIAKP